MKVFDFDNTLYRGESSLDFSLYMIRTHKKILLYLPVIMANTISSIVDLDRIEILHFNFKDNKVTRFRELYGDAKIDAFYTDSYNDRALMEISDKVFLVKKGKIKRIQ